tara:strand:+ start:2023 stop:3048 length:1026 start_codon:yes stop_codon:yes gene_type:complete
MSKDLAIVILNWNGKKHLETYIPSVVKNSGNSRVILADNASTDDSINFIKKNYPTIEIVENTENGGFAKGYNEALKNVDATYYCLLNSDVEVTPGWTETPIKVLQENSDVAICQPKIKDYLNKDYFEYAGAGGGFIDQLGYPFCRGRIFNSLEKDTGQYDDECEIFWATGACMFIKSAIFHELNGFDANYFAHMEEIDLCWRIKNRGYKIKYNGNSTVYHLGGGTLSNINPKKTFLNFRNSLLTLYKNEPKESKSSVIFKRMVLDGIAGVKFLLEGKPKHLMAILKAHQSYYQLKKDYKKVAAISFQKTPDRYQGLVIVEHFLKGKKYFNQLKKGFSFSRN